MKTTEQVKCNLGRNKSIDNAADGNPERPQDEDKSLAVDICNTTPE
jgi:hypothetical protein